MQKNGKSGDTSAPEQLLGLSRRDWLRGLIMLGGVGVIAGGAFKCCRYPGVGPLGSSGEMFDPPFSTWRALQEVVRRSPDHLIARSDEIVGSGDARALLSFVAENFQVIPGGELRWFDPANTVRWGAAAALRSGTGTLRELVEMTVMLLGRMGVAARVKVVDARALPEERCAALLALRPEIKFVLKWSTPERAAMRRHALGPRGQRPAFTTKQWREEARKLAAEVLRHMGDRPAEQARGFDPSLPSLPVVEVDFAAGRELIFPYLPGAPSLPPGQVMVSDAAAPSEPWQVQVRLLAAQARAPRQLEELVAKTWSATELIGRQLMIRCLPNVTLEQAAVVSFAAVRTFTPMLSLHGPRLAEDEALSLSMAGEPLTLAGERISSDSQGLLQVDGVALEVPEIGADARARSVIELTIDVDARAYPELIVHATPRDQHGEVVGGLSAHNFGLVEQGQPVTFLLVANQPAPRITLLVDQSASMPSAYRGSGSVHLLGELSTVVKRRFPAARLQLLTTDSDLWKWLDIALAERSDLVIFITDGDQDGPVADVVLQRLRRSGPTLFIDAGKQDPSVFTPFLEVTGGQRVAVASAPEALQVMTERLAMFEVASYRFSLAATGMEPVQRTLGLKVLSSDEPTGVHVEARYRVPAAADRLVLPGLCTLALEIALSRRYEPTIVVRRILAGFDPDSDNTPTVEDARAVRDAMFGCHLLHIEGGGTTEALRLDEQLESQLSAESLIKAVRLGEALDPHWMGHRGVIPSELLALTGRIGDPERAGLVYEEGMRMVLFGLVPQIGTNLVRRRVDVLPTAVFRSALEDPALGFQSTARASALLAVLEARLFPDSTYSVLRSRSLVLDPSRPSEIDLVYGKDWNEIRAMIRRSGVLHSAQRFLVPVGGGGACWMVKPSSGELYGILNGAGGAEIIDDIRRQTHEFESVISVYAMVMEKMASAAGVPAAGAFALAVVAEYSKTLVKLYAAVSYVLINMRAEELDDAIRQILVEFAENVIKEIFPVIFDDEKIAEDINSIIAVCYMAKG